MIIRSKILHLWQKSKEFAKDFDFGTSEAKNTDYVHDPTEKLSTKDCGNKGLCSVYWAEGLRLSGIAFTERKAIRLAFHDCVPYKSGSGGCDGCLNFEDEQNLKDNNLLQHSAAILVRIKHLILKCSYSIQICSKCMA